MEVSAAAFFQSFDKREWCHMIFCFKGSVKVRQIMESDRQRDF